MTAETGDVQTPGAVNEVGFGIGVGNGDPSGGPFEPDLTRRHQFGRLRKITTGQLDIGAGRVVTGIETPRNPIDQGATSVAGGHLTSVRLGDQFHLAGRRPTSSSCP